MSTPSIKGVAFRLLVEAIEDLIEEGRLDREELELKLPAEDLEILDQELIPGLWYPIESFGRLLSLVLEKLGKMPGQWPQVGFEAAQRLLSIHTYEAMLGSASKRGDRSGFALVHLIPLFLNFSKWSFDGNPGDGSVYHVEVEEGEPLPDALLCIAEGCIEYLSQRVRGVRLKVSSERLGDGRIVFRATQP